MITYALENVDDVFDAYALGVLMQYHNEAVQEGVRHFDLNNVEQYRRIQKTGQLRLMVARQDGMAIGFCTCFVSRSNQHAELVGQIDMIFVRPDRRTRMIGLDLVTRLMAQLRTEGVTLFRGMSSAKINSEPLWRWLGFERVGTIYERSCPAIMN